MGGFFGVVLVADVAHDHLEDVLERDDAAHPAELVDDHRHVQAAMRASRAARSRRPAFRATKLTGARTRSPSGVSLQLVVLEQAKEVFGVEKADDVVDLVAVNREARVALAGDEAKHLGRGVSTSMAETLRAGDHHVAGDQVLQLEHVADHLRRLRAERARASALRRRPIRLRFR